MCDSQSCKYIAEKQTKYIFFLLGDWCALDGRMHQDTISSSFRRKKATTHIPWKERERQEKTTFHNDQFYPYDQAWESWKKPKAETCLDFFKKLLSCGCLLRSLEIEQTNKKIRFFYSFHAIINARFHLDISRGFGITGPEPRTQRQTGSLLGCKSPDYQAE